MFSMTCFSTPLLFPNWLGKLCISSVLRWFGTFWNSQTGSVMVSARKSASRHATANPAMLFPNYELAPGFKWKQICFYISFGERNTWLSLLFIARFQIYCSYNWCIVYFIFVVLHVLLPVGILRKFPFTRPSPCSFLCSIYAIYLSYSS